MVHVKAFAMLVVAAFTLDLAAYDGHYRRELGVQMRNVAWHLGSLHWTGFLGR